MTLQVKTKEWVIANANQSYSTRGYNFNMIFEDGTLDIEQLSNDLNGIEEGFTLDNETFTGYSVINLIKTFEEDRAVITLSLFKAKNNG